MFGFHPKVRSAAQLGTLIVAVAAVLSAVGIVVPAAVVTALVTLVGAIGAAYFTASPAE